MQLNHAQFKIVWVNYNNNYPNVEMYDKSASHRLDSNIAMTHEDIVLIDIYQISDNFAHVHEIHLLRYLRTLSTPYMEERELDITETMF